jgi:copper binding protein CusF
VFHIGIDGFADKGVLFLELISLPPMRSRYHKEDFRASTEDKRNLCPLVVKPCRLIQGRPQVMTMTFMVKDKMLFDKLTADRKVEFQLAKQGADYVVTAVK